MKATLVREWATAIGVSTRIPDELGVKRWDGALEARDGLLLLLAPGRIVTSSFT